MTGPTSVWERFLTPEDPDSQFWGTVLEKTDHFWTKSDSGEEKVTPGRKKVTQGGKSDLGDRNSSLLDPDPSLLSLLGVRFL